MTNVSEFVLSSFSLPCVASASSQSLTAPNVPCPIDIAGYQGNDNQVSATRQLCSQQFQYQPSNMVGPVQMASSGQVLSCSADIQFLLVQYSLPGDFALYVQKALVRRLLGLSKKVSTTGD